MYIKEIKMEMCFKFLDGSNTTIFLESMRFCVFTNKQIYVEASASWKQRVHCKPESQMFKL